MVVALLLEEAEPVEDDEEEAADVDLPLSEKLEDEEEPLDVEGICCHPDDVDIALDAAFEVEDGVAGPSWCEPAVKGVVTAWEVFGAEVKG